MGSCEFLGSTILTALLLTSILFITRNASASGAQTTYCCKVNLTASAKNRLAGVAILIFGACVIGLLKSCAATAETKIWLETLTALATGLTSALAAVFIGEGFVGYKDTPNK